METIAFCEIDPFCRKVLKKHWPDVPIYEDVRKLKGGEIAADIICGGYPCQPFSVAGQRRGKEDDRHLWPEVARLLSEVRPRWFIGENVAGHVSMGLDEVLSDLEGQGYDAQSFIIPACAVNTKHRRDRVWIVADTEGERIQRGRAAGIKKSETYVGETISMCSGSGTRAAVWASEPAVGRVANGISRRVDRLRSLGNAVVPQIPEIIGKAIMEIENARL